MARIFAYIVHKSGVADDSAAELAAAARKIDANASPVAVVIGWGAELDAVCESLRSFYTEVWKVANQAIAYPNAELVRKALVNILPRESIVLVPHAHFGIDLSPGLSIKLNAAFVSDVLAIEGIDGTALKLVRQEFGGQVSAHVHCDISSGAVLNLRPGAFKPQESAPLNGVVVDKSAEVGALTAGRRYLETVVPEAGDVDITKHAVLVSVGRGIQEQDNIAIAQELADALGAAVSCSRLGSTPPALEHQAQDDGDLKSSDSKVLLHGDPIADVSMPIVHPKTKPAWYRRCKATDWITAVATMTMTVAVTCFGIAFQKQIKNATAQLTQSETSMRAMQGRVRADERAWVGLIEAVAQPLTANGGGFTIKLQNTGKTPALDLQISDVITIADIDQSAELPEQNITARNPAGTLMPGAVFTTDVWFKTSPDAVSSLTHDQLSAVNFIHITYKDVFQAPHTTKVCFYWRSSLPRVKPCGAYNELN